MKFKTLSAITLVFVSGLAPAAANPFITTQISPIAELKVETDIQLERVEIDLPMSIQAQINETLQSRNTASLTSLLAGQENTQRDAQGAE